MIQCQVHTEHYRGDHSADVVIAVEPRPNETVSDFAKRVLNTYAPSSEAHIAHIEIRMIAPDDGEQADD